MSLSEQMIECVDTASVKVNDYDQRSAIGMARSWVENREPIKWKVEQVEHPNRDQLAKDLVALMGDFEPQECIDALLAVRKHVNAPYQLEIRGGARLGKPKEQKKARESEK